MSEIKWQEPPADARGRDKWGPVADELRAQPGRWALVAEGVSASMSTAFKRGRIIAFQPAGSFEAVTRNVVDGRADIYARYVGKSDA